MSEKAHLSIRIPKRLMKDLKILAIENEKTLTNVVRDILEEYVEQNKK
jgi:predicted DNA-binding protein